MFKKLKDKLAEEVKSSPQRIQLFAQAAQAAVTSASSSISDITNSDLFSIGDNESQQPRPIQPHTSQQNMFQDVALMQSPSDSMDSSQEISDGQRQRRLSNSSFASDISFRLPSYETPSMYHLQSDMEVSASEADDRGFSGGAVTLDRVTKEQLYAAYKRTQERYKKYRTQYGDLARHYKLLERENAKARSVLVETQDKALRRISELKEQCTLEQSAKAHLEKALRVEIEEKNMKIDALNTKAQLLQNILPSDVNNESDNLKKPQSDSENDVHLINLDNENTNKPEDSGAEVSSLTNKIEKMEQLLNKYKESLKTSKEKNSQITIELQMLSKEIENKNKQIVDLKSSEEHLNEAKTKIQELNSINEELQNQVNTFDFTKTKQLSTLELDLQKANEEIADLRSKIEVFSKREEEYAISLAENKLSIHKELESKEAEIKSLKDKLSESKNEIQSFKIVVEDYKNNISVLEDEKVKLTNDCAELTSLKTKITEMDVKLQELSKKSQSLEQSKLKADEEYKCLQLQLKQETAEKLAMIDRNQYLESKNTQITEDNTKKSTIISKLESEIQLSANHKDLENDLALIETEKSQLFVEMNTWKEKCAKLEHEIQEEREELVKLQTEIEKLLSNHELVQAQNAEFRSKIVNLTTECAQQQESVLQYKASISSNMKNILKELKLLRKNISLTSDDTKLSLRSNKESLSNLKDNVHIFLNSSIRNYLIDIESVKTSYDSLKLDYDKLQTEISTNNTKTSEDYNEFDSLQKENNELKVKLKEIESEKYLSDEKLIQITQEYETTVNLIKSLECENQKLAIKIKDLEETIKESQAMFDSAKANHLTTTEKLNTIVEDKQKLGQIVEALETKNVLFETEMEQLKKQHAVAQNEMKLKYEDNLKLKEDEIKKLSFEEQDHTDIKKQLYLLSNEKSEFEDKIRGLEVNHTISISEIEALSQKYKAAVEKINELNIEIIDKAESLQKSHQIQSSLKEDIAKYTLSLSISNDTVSQNETIKQTLKENLKQIEDKNVLLNTEIEKLRDQHKAAENQIIDLTSTLTSKTQECEKNLRMVNDLEDCIRTLTQENISLKTETANFDSNIKVLESEINDIKMSHAEIETEKDRLSGIIEKLESKQQNILLKNDKDSQTELNTEKTVEKEEASAVLENKWVMEHKQTAMASTASLNLKKENLEDLYEQYSTLRINYDTLKDENKRLQSDIEGLQAYLTKISKENTLLNDKLRESIATSENTTDSDQYSSDVKELKNEIQVSKERINELQRENSLLIEENLELKDQLQTQNYSNPTEAKTVTYNDKDLQILKVKYNDLLQSSSELEKQNIDLEQINNSLSFNVQQLQDKNEKLKRSNDKLERRLDEALVSLRHLHALQENTELEYLRNILYEYLTGSGTHSVTLAKVLAAIVKFDEVQTQMVLQKEKERQGFLRQLGII